MLKLGAFLFCVCYLYGTTVFAAVKGEDVERVIQSHDLSTALSMGEYYLKGQAILAVRGFLLKMGGEVNLGNDWTPKNKKWKDLEILLLREIYTPINKKLTDMEWLYADWKMLLYNEYSQDELATLASHLETAVGKKQAKIIDHYVSQYVINTLTFSGKFLQVKGTETERQKMQQLFAIEGREMRFSVTGSENAEGQAFALSRLGKKYFVNNVIKLVGIINHYLDDVARTLPNDVEDQRELIYNQLQNSS